MAAEGPIMHWFVGTVNGSGVLEVRATTSMPAFAILSVQPGLPESTFRDILVPIWPGVRTLASGVPKGVEQDE